MMRAVIVVGLLAHASGQFGNMDEIPAMKKGEPDAAHTSDEWKIWAYTAAAPDYLGKDATVVDDGKPIRKGTNGWTCLAANPKGPRDTDNGWHSAHEAMPVCCDANAMDWVVPYAAGKGEKPDMKGDGWAWMLMGDMGEDNNVVGKVADWEWGRTHPENWIQGGSHLMLLPQNPDTWAGYNSDFSTGGPYIMFKDDAKFGNTYAHVMIPGPHYYHYQKTASPSSTGPAAEPNAPHTSDEWKAWAIGTAAPAFLNSGITVVEGKKILKKPEVSNGFTCLAANPHGPADPEKGWKTPHEAMPVCVDANAMDWVGKYAAADPASGKGETPHLAADGFAWMLHGDMGEDNTKVGKVDDFAWGQDHKDNWIQGGPHLMLLPKSPDSWATASQDYSKGTPYIMFGADSIFGNKYAHVMIPQPGYYHYQKDNHGLNTEVTPPDSYWWMDAPRKFELIQGGSVTQDEAVPTVVPMFTVSLMLFSLVLAGVWFVRARSQGPRVLESGPAINALKSLNTDEVDDEEIGQVPE